MTKILDKDKELLVVTTPLGHLGDITYRSVEVLKNCSLILCEDKRVTGKLLKFYDIPTPTRTYNAHIESRLDSYKGKLESTLSRLFETHFSIALVSDAGTPCISDPGYVIVNFCYQHNIPVTPIPGPSAGITALSVSGFQAKNSLFYGFLPNKKGKRKNILMGLLNSEKKVIIFYESPYRLENLLANLSELDENGLVFVGREMTKKFEEYLRGTPQEVLIQLSRQQIRGEFVVIWKNSN